MESFDGEVSQTFGPIVNHCSTNESNVPKADTIEENKANIFLTNLKIDYDSEPDQNRRNSKGNKESFKSEIHFKSNTVFSWENISVWNKKQTYLFDSFKRSKKQKTTQINKQFVNGNLNLKNGSVIDNYLVLNSLSIETQSNQSASTSSKLSSIDSSEKKNIPERNILNNVSGIVQSGEFLAIMGASGAGKTTLLNFLTCRNLDNYETNGQIRINGKIVGVDEVTKKSAYVQQDDLFLGTITVKEHLIFLAMLKMGPKYMKHEIYARVDQILEEFHLEKCKNNKIGYYNSKKGISGGEKRRLAFASEILTDPAVLFCDEPTSGLDSYMALHVVNTLENLARKGKIIICTIHQPSSKIFNKFDKLCLLADGKVAYFGPQNVVYEYFQSINFQCPLKYNPADYFIEILAYKIKENNQNIKIICDSYDISALKQKNMNEIYSVCKVNSSNNTQTNGFENNKISRNKKRTKFISPFYTQFMWLIWRQTLNTIREPVATRIMFVQSIVMGVFLGFTYFQINDDQSSIQNKNGLCFLMLMQACLCYLFGVASHYHDQWNVTIREIKNNIYSVNCYFISKTLAEVPQNILFPSFTVTIIYWLSNLNPNYDVYFIITSIIVMASNAAVGFGSLLAIITPNIDSTVGLIGPVFFPLLLFSGFLINTNSIPVYFVWIKYISWVYYANEAIMIVLWRDVTNIKCQQSLLNNNNSTNKTTNLYVNSQCLLTGDDVLNQLAINKNNFKFDILMVLAFTAFLHIAGGILLYIKSKSLKFKDLFSKCSDSNKSAYR